MSEYAYPVMRGALERYARALGEHPGSDVSASSITTAIATNPSGESGQIIWRLEQPHRRPVRTSPDFLFHGLNQTATLVFTDVTSPTAEAARSSATMVWGQLLEFHGEEFPEHGISDVSFPRKTIFTKKLTFKTKELPRWSPTIVEDDMLE